MQDPLINSKFIQAMVIQFGDVLPPGSKKQLQEEFAVSETTPRKVLTGKWSNEKMVLSALKMIIRQTDLNNRFLQQFPDQLMVKLHRELKVLPYPVEWFGNEKREGF